MTPAEKNIVRSLIAVAWADGVVEAPEEGVIEGFLGLYDASDEEEAELKEYAKQTRSLDDVPFDELDDEGKEILLSNAALLSASDGTTSDSEKVMLDELVKRLGFSDKDAKRIIKSSQDGAIAVGSRLLIPEE